MIINAGGKIGAWVSDFLLYMFGYLAYLVPLMFVFGAWYLFREARERSSIDYYLLGLKAIGFILIILGGTGLFNLYLINVHYHIPFEAGGIVGNLIAHLLATQLNLTGATVFLLLALMAGVTWYTGVSWLKLWRLALAYGGKASWQLIKCCQPQKALRGLRYLRRLWPEKPTRTSPITSSHTTSSVQSSPRKKISILTPKLAKQSDPAMSTTLQEPAKRKKVKKNPLSEGLPSLDLLDAPKQSAIQMINEDELEARSQLVEQTLTDFGVNAKVVAVHPGPVITRYELELAPGVKASRLSGLAKDIARSLAMISLD